VAFQLTETTDSDSYALRTSPVADSDPQFL